MNYVETFRRIYEFGWVTVATAISSAVFNKWSSSVSAADYTYMQMTLHGAGSFAIWLILLTVPFWFINVPRIRHWLFRHSAIEGWWLQKVDIAERPWSLSHLSKNLGFGWTYSGYAYDPSGKVAATWDASDIKLDDHAGFWIFKGDSHRINTSGIPTRTGNVLSVLYSKQYYEAFQNDPLAQLPGRISDLDYEDSPTAASILLVRVTSADWKAADINRQSTRLPPDQFKRLIDHMKSNGRLQMIWIDSDGGVDDALAIAVACKIVSGHKIAFSTVFGNVSARQAAHNIRTLLHRLGVDAPILVGAERASDGFAQSATDIHGLDGLGNVIGEVRPDEQFDSLSESIESPLERARWLNEDVHILSIGPATNIPSIARMLGAERISGITMMTGAIFDKGNITEDAEFNAYNDPIALANILHSGIPITIVPLDICRKLIFRREDLTSLSTFGAAAPMLSEAHKFYMASYEQAEGISGCFPHDTIALLSMLYPSKFNFWRIPFDVDSSTDHRGQLRFDINGAYHARFCLGGDLRWVRQFMRSWSILA